MKPMTSAAERLSVRIHRVCEILDCEPTQVSRLIGQGELEAHGFGIRGVRVYLDSVEAYRQRRQIAPKTKAAALKAAQKPAISPASERSQLAAVAQLRELKLI